MPRATVQSYRAGCVHAERTLVSKYQLQSKLQSPRKVPGRPPPAARPPDRPPAQAYNVYMKGMYMYVYPPPLGPFFKGPWALGGTPDGGVPKRGACMCHQSALPAVQLPDSLFYSLHPVLQT